MLPFEAATRAAEIALLWAKAFAFSGLAFALFSFASHYRG